MTLSEGTRLGPYTIESLLGAGGMGEVYRATDTRLDRPVALKILPARLSSSSALRERFEREARTISALTHPNICTLYDVGQENGLSFLVMELLEGESLAERLARGRMPMPEALEFAVQIARALDRAHRAGITHRDLKPGNVMLSRGTAKLLDFGLAKMTASMADPDGPTEHRKRLTEEGTIVGTFQYMAPEQLEGREADHRSDIFSFGAMLYEMLAGVPAFEGQTRTSLIASILAREPRPLTELQPLAPRQLQHIVDRCLRKNPEQRWQSAGDLALELSWVAQSGSSELSGVQPMPRRRSGTWLFAPVVLLVAAAAAAAAWGGLWWKRPEVEAIRASVAPPPGVTVGINNATGNDSLAISPDGRILAFVGVDAEGKRKIWVRRLSERSAKEIAGTEGARFPFWSPDSRSLAFFSNGKLRTVLLDGSPPVAVCDVGSNPLPGDWSDDGVILFSPGSGTPIHRVSAAGGTSVAITKLDAAAGESTHRWARFLDGGRSFLYLAGAHELPLTSEVNAVYRAELGSDERTLVARHRSNVSPVGDWILYARDGTLYARQFSARTGEATGDPIAIAEGIQIDELAFLANYTASRNGRLVWISQGAAPFFEIVTLDRSGQIAGRSVPPSDAPWWNASPDGRWIAMTLADPTQGSDIWLAPVEEGPRTRLTTGGTASDPVWSPDSNQIAFAGRDRTIFIRELAPGGATRPLIALGTWGGATAWSPDGRWIAYWQFDPQTTTGYDAGILSTIGETAPRLLAQSPGGDFPLAFSPDSRWMLYSSNESGGNEVYAVSIDDPQRRQQISTGGARVAVWYGDEIWYLRKDSTLVSVTVTERTGELHLSSPRPLFRDERIGSLQRVGGGRILASRAVSDPQPATIELLTDWRSLVRRASR